MDPSRISFGEINLLAQNTFLSQDRLKYLERKLRTSTLAGFHEGPLLLVEFRFGLLVFQEVRKPEHPEKNPQSKREPTTNSDDAHLAAGQNRARAIQCCTDGR